MPDSDTTLSTVSSCDTTDIARRLLVSGIQYGGHHFRISVVGKCRQRHIRDGYGRKYGVEVGIAAPSLTVEKLFPFPVWWPPS